MSKILTGIAFLTTVAIAGWFIVAWKQIRLTELRNKAITDCADVAISSGTGSFNGAVYKICVEDKKYETKVK